MTYDPTPRRAQRVEEPPRDALRRRLTDRELADDRLYQLEREERERDNERAPEDETLGRSVSAPRPE